MIALIPARAGSKGIPGKNLIPLAGKPLLAYTIEAALASAQVERVIVSTESAEIAAAAKSFGADVPFLRAVELAQDTSLAREVYLEAVNHLARAGVHSAALCVLQPTSPLRTPQDIDLAIARFKSKDADAVISVCEAPQPISWYREIDEHGRLSPHQAGEAHARNRQAEPVLYIPNGAIYVLRTDFLRHSLTYYSEKTFAYIMPRERSVDIDWPVDLIVAEALLRAGRSKK